MTSEADQARAMELHELAQSLDDEEAALSMYGEALRLVPERASTHYNMGLIFKYRGEWKESFSHNKQSTDLDPEDEASNWNLAIAATALRDWQTARSVWKRLGLSIELGNQPIESDFGITPVRLNPDDSGEVVWGRRIDPVRVRIDNIPFPVSGYRCGDIVLHDGAPVGHRVSNGREYAVFNVLELFEASKLSTFEAEIYAASVEDVTALSKVLDAAGIAHEDWTANTRILCRQCSEGIPHEHHDAELPSEWTAQRTFGIATDAFDVVEEELRAWGGPTRRVLRLESKLGPLSQQ